ncbi:hypothetical protein [Coralloluteibacterium thermophilus]|uniref:Lipoprotein n=1 Tax=Coralloluteibacterium thermophilum TaxID=2707049 RepID=A0ABV9NT58_9GAMM
MPARRFLLALAAPLVLVACSRAPADEQASVDEVAPVLVVTRVPEAGISIAHPENVPARRAAPGAPASAAQPLLALRLPGGDEAVRAELRIGTARGNAEVARCTEDPETLHAGTRTTEVLGGVEFVRFDSGETNDGESRFVRGYRAVRDRTCYAIDLVVTGDAETLAPGFARARAVERLHALLEGLRFDGVAQEVVAAQ